MLTIKECLIKTLEENNIEYGIDENSGSETFSFVAGTVKGAYEALALCQEEENLFVFHLSLGYRIEDEERLIAALYMTEANYNFKYAYLFIEPETDFAIVRCIMRIDAADDEKRCNLVKFAMYQAMSVADDQAKKLLVAISG